MRTIDQTAEISAATEKMPASRILRLFGLSGFLSIVRRRATRNSTVALDDHQLRDIGLIGGHNEPYDGRGRAARQDELLREAHRAAAMMAMGFSGR